MSNKKLSLPPPTQVSPTIKFFRWSLLIAGAIYGGLRNNVLARKEVVVRQHEKELKACRDSKLAEERRIASDKDIAMLAALADPAPIEPDHDHDHDHEHDH